MQWRETHLGAGAVLPCNVIVSGHVCDPYDTQFAHWRRHNITVSGHCGTQKESFLINYPPPAILDYRRYLGETFREREAIGRRRRTLLNIIARAAPEAGSNP